MAKLVTRRRVDLGHAPNLRACLEQDAECVRLMAEVDAICTDFMYSPELHARFGIYERFEIFVTPEYAKTVENNLDQILYGCCDERNLTMPDGSFLPSPKDALMLLAANRLRCLGLLWGLFPEEREEGSRDFQNSRPILPRWELRNPSERATADCGVLKEWLGQFAARASRYVVDNWRLNCSWTEAWRFVLAQIISASLPGSTFTPVPANEVSEEIVGFRIKKTAYVLRLASICSVGKDACPPEVQLRLYPGDFIDSREAHLNVVEWINNYGFDHGRRLIEFQALVPPVLEVPSPGSDERMLPVAHVDFQPEVEFFGATLQRILDEISGYLSECANTAFQTIAVTCQRAQAFQADIVIRYKLPEHWSLAVAGASNASESASMVALVLSSFCHEWIASEERGRSEILLAQTVSEVLTGSRYLHPFSSLIVQLANDYGAIVDSWAGQPSESQVSRFRETLDSYLVARECFGNNIAEKIRDEEVLTDVDCVILYGYGRTALSSLIWSSFSGRVLLVRAPEEQRAPWVADETDRVIQLLDKHQLAYSESSVAEVPARLAQLNAQGKTFLFLSGCLAALESEPEQRRFICSIGTRSIATTVHDMDGQVIVVSEYDKLIVGNKNKAMMDEMVSALEKPKIHPEEFRKWKFVDTLDSVRHVDRSYTSGIELESQQSGGDSDLKFPYLVGGAILGDSLVEPQRRTSSEISCPALVFMRAFDGCAEWLNSLPVNCVLLIGDIPVDLRQVSVACDDATAVVAAIRSREFSVIDVNQMMDKPNEELGCLSDESLMKYFDYNPIMTGILTWLWRTRSWIVVGLEGAEEDALYGCIEKVSRVQQYNLMGRLGPQDAKEYITSSVFELSDSVVNHGLPWLHQVRVKDIGPFQDATFQLGRYSTLILGDNSSGKTSLMRAIACALTGEDPNARDSLQWLLRVGQKLGTIDLEMTFLHMESDESSTSDTTNQDDPTMYVESCELARGSRGVSIRKHVSCLSAVECGLLPVFGFASLRGLRTANPAGPSLEKHQIRASPGDLLPILIGNADYRLGNLKQWVLNLDYETRRRNDKRKRFTTTMDRLFQLLAELLGDSTIRFHKIDEAENDIMVETPDGILPLDALSQGMAAVLGWVGALMLRITQLYPDSPDPLTEFAIVMVDEVDAHMHPEWQRRIIPAVLKMFPNVQFIFTTHAPLVLAEAKGAVVYRIEKNASGEREIRAVNSERTGVGAGALLASPYFGLETQLDRDTEHLLMRHTELMSRTELTESEATELRELGDVLFRMGFATDTGDPTYSEYLRHKRLSETPSSSAEISEESIQHTLSELSEWPTGGENSDAPH